MCLREEGAACDAPEFSNRRQTNAPSLRSIESFEDSFPSLFMLRRIFAVGIDQNVGIDSDHRFFSSHSYMASRLDKSRSRGKPPFTVTSLTCLFCCRLSGFRSTRRRPSSTRARRGRRSSAARFRQIQSRFHASHITIFMGIIPSTSTQSQRSLYCLRCQASALKCTPCKH
jgi:hypothetical protein